MPAQDKLPSLMLDQTGCWSGVHTFCCPASKEQPTCTWRGKPSHTGKCGGGCESGEAGVGTLTVGCTSDHQSACCTVTDSIKPYAQCKWVGSSPSCSSAGGHASCPSDYPTFVVASSAGAGGEQVCATGSKSYCCKDPIPDQFQECQWYSKATH